MQVGCAMIKPDKWHECYVGYMDADLQVVNDVEVLRCNVMIVDGQWMFDRPLVSRYRGMTPVELCYLLIVVEGKGYPVKLEAPAIAYAGTHVTTRIGKGL